MRCLRGEQRPSSVPKQAWLPQALEALAAYKIDYKNTKLLEYHTLFYTL
jgi:hypothetical protein